MRILFADGSETDAVGVGVGMIKSGAEREAIGRRTREGKLRIAKQGTVVASIAPYGYRIVREYDHKTGKKISAVVDIDPDEIEHAVNIFHWLIYERLSIGSIVNRLHDEQVLPRGAKQKMIKRFGRVLAWDRVPEDIRKYWNLSSVRRVLENPIITGRWCYNRQKTTRVEIEDRMRRVTLGERDESELVYWEAPAAISEELFNHVQAVLRKNRQQFTGRPPKHTYLLKSLLFCPCGRRMVGAPGGAYRCGHQQDTSVKEERCTSPRLPQVQTDELVRWYVKNMLLYPESLLEQYDKQQAEAEAENAALEDQAERIEAEIRKGETRLDNLVDLFLDEEIDRVTYRRKRKEIEGASNDHRQELARIRAQLRGLRSAPKTGSIC